MKKQLFVAIFFLFISTISFSQTTPPSLQWERSQNGSSSLSHTIVKALTDVSGNVYTLSYANEDMVVVKFNSATSVVQSYVYNNHFNTDDYPKDFTFDASGNVYIVGRSWDNENWRPTATIVKFNAAGDLAWELNYNSSGWIYPTNVTANAIALDASNNIYITGSMNDSLIVAKITNAGVVQTVTHVTIGGTDLGEGNDIALDAAGNMYVAGRMEVATDTYDAVAFKVTTAGTVQWTKQIIGAAGAEDNSFNIGVDNSSNSYVLSNIADTSATNITPYLTKYNASGAQQYQKKLHVTNQYSSDAVELIVDNLGNTYSAIQVRTTSSDCYSRIIKHSSSGTATYDATIDIVGQSYDAIHDIYLDGSNNLFSTGQSGNPSIDNIYYSKLNSSGGLVFANLLSGSSIAPYSQVRIVADPSGFMNILGTSVKIFNSRLSNTGVFQFEGVFAGEANTYDRAIKVFADGNHSIYSLGYVTNDNSGSDAVLSKYDAQGNIQWQNMIDASGGNDDPYDMDHDGDFNIYITKGLPVGGEVVKYDSIGSPVWSNPSTYRYSKIITDNPGFSYLAGCEAFGTQAFTSFNVKKIDAVGNTVYETNPSLVAGYNLRVTSIAKDGGDRIYATGTRIYNTGSPVTRVIVQKFSSNGDSLWLRELTLIDSTDSYSQYYTNSNKIIVDATNNVYVMGNGYNPAGFGSSYTFVTKFDNNGTELWQKIFNFGGSTEDSGTMEIISNNELVIFTGGSGNYIIRRISCIDGSTIFEQAHYAASSNAATVLKIDANENYYCFGEALGQGSISRDLYLMKLDPLGNLIWKTTKAGSRTGNDFARDMDVTANGRIYLLADMLNSNGSQSDLSLLKYCDIATPTISTPNNFSALCPGSNVTITANGGASSSYVWSPGNETTSQITVNLANDYFATITKPDGCFKNTDTLHLTIKPTPATPQICLVTVDSLSTHNIIVWDKSSFTGVDSVKIYREDVTNVYTHIGTVDNDSLSEYHDLGANPNITTKRYKISAIDSCGQESLQGNYHNTLYIVSNGSGQFSWNPLYTIENTANPVNNYVLMRDDNSNGNWNQIASTAGTQNTIVDPSFASFPNASYRVETLWNISCLATRGAINTTRSNIKSPTSIGINEMNDVNLFSVSPNPANESILVSINNREENVRVEIYNSLGQKVIEQKLENNETKIVVEQLQAGTYFVKLIGKQNQSVKKLIKY